MSNNKEVKQKAMPDWIKNVLYVIGSIGAIIALFLKPIEVKVDKLEKAFSKIEAENKKEEKETNKRLRNLEIGQGVILTKIEQLKK